MQIMVDKEVGDQVGGLRQLTPTSTCVLIEGVLAATLPGTKQKVGARRQPPAGAAALPARPRAPLHAACCRQPRRRLHRRPRVVDERAPGARPELLL